MIFEWVSKRCPNALLARIFYSPSCHTSVIVAKHLWPVLVREVRPGHWVLMLEHHEAVLNALFYHTAQPLPLTLTIWPSSGSLSVVVIKILDPLRVKDLIERCRYRSIVLVHLFQVLDVESGFIDEQPDPDDRADHYPALHHTRAGNKVYDTQTLREFLQ